MRPLSLVPSYSYLRNQAKADKKWVDSGRSSVTRHVPKRGRVIVKCAARKPTKPDKRFHIRLRTNNLGCRVATSSAASHIGGLRRSVDIGKAACVLHAWQATAMVKRARDTRFPDVSAGRNSTLR